MHKNNLSTAATLIALVIFISGCASIVSKSSYPVVLDSDPDGATITVVNKSGDTIVRSTTPTSVTLKASKGFFSKEENLNLLTEKELMATKKSEINRECPSIANPNYVPY